MLIFSPTPPAQISFVMEVAVRDVEFLLHCPCFSSALCRGSAEQVLDLGRDISLDISPPQQHLASPTRSTQRARDHAPPCPKPVRNDSPLLPTSSGLCGFLCLVALSFIFFYSSMAGSRAVVCVCVCLSLWSPFMQRDLCQRSDSNFE